MYLLIDCHACIISWPINCSLLEFWFDKQVYARKLVKTAFANWENVQKFDNEISITDHLSPSPKLGDMSRCHLGNLVTVNEHHSLEFRNASVSTL